LTRGLATGRVDPGDIVGTVFRELRVGLVMGVVCGLVVGGAAALLFSDGHHMLGVVVCVAMIAAMTVAATVGSMAPAIMQRAGIDPAIASGPIVTTANDSIGIVIYLTTAMFFLDQLRG